MPVKKNKMRRGYKRPQNNYSQLATAALGAPQLDETPEGLLRREYAWRAATVVSEIVVPFSLAGGYAVIGAGAGAILAQTGGQDAAPAAAIGALLAGAVSYAVITKRQLQSLWAIEEYGEETETEAPVMTPAPATEPRFIPINPYAGQQAQRDTEKQRKREKLINFVWRCANLGTGLSSHANSLSREEWAGFRDLLIQQGYAKWTSSKSRNQGWELTAPPEEIIDGISL